jgi:phage gpG-like protein
MSGMRLVIDLHGDEEVASGLARMAERTQRSRIARGNLGGVKRLAPATLARKRRQHLSTRPLVGKTGDLLNSVSQRGHARQVLRIENDELTFGTSVYYARFHQFGEGVPRRRVLNVTPKDRVPIARQIREFLIGGLR